MKCLYVAENMTKCPLMRGVCLREVFVSGGSTVLINSLMKTLLLLLMHVTKELFELIIIMLQ